MAGDIRKIIHVDMDAFYAAVEQRNHPEWRGRPVVVGGRPDSRGVVSTCSYEARRYGIHSAMPASEAYRRCPQAVFVTNADFGEYRRVSGQIGAIFRDITDLVEPLSLDEAYLDVTRNSLGEPSATRLAQTIRERIHRETGLTASAGVSYNKSLAKIASDWTKPDGLTVIRPEEALAFLSDLPVRKFWGVGPVTAARMNELGIRTGADLRAWPLWKLIDAFGSSGPWYYDLCRGVDTRPVSPRRDRKSLGKERTFPKDINDAAELAGILGALAAEVWSEVTRRDLAPKTVTVKVKYADFRQVTRSRSGDRAINGLDQFSAVGRELLTQTEAGRRPCRLIGITASNFASELQGLSDQLQLRFSGDPV